MEEIYTVYDYLKHLKKTTGKSAPKYSGEEMHQFCCVTWFKSLFQDVPIYGNSTANNFSPDASGQNKFKMMGRIAKMRNLGAESGWPDIQICKPFGDPVGGLYIWHDFNGLFVELKNPTASSLPLGKKGDRVSLNAKTFEQTEILCKMYKQGFAAVYCYGFEQFQRIVRRAYLDEGDGRFDVLTVPENHPMTGWDLLIWRDA